MIKLIHGMENKNNLEINIIAVVLRYLSIFMEQRAFWKGSKALSDEGFIIKVGDLVDSEFVNSQLTSYDLIIHCAAKSSVWGSYDTFYKANVVAKIC